MRLLFIHDSGGHVGGAETYLSTVRKLLEKSGQKTFLFAMDGAPSRKTDDSYIMEDSKTGRIRHHIEHYYRKPDLYSALTEYINETKPDVINIQNNHRYPNTILSASIDSEIPVVQTVHDIGLVCPTGLCYKPGGILCEGGFGFKCLASGCLSPKIFSYETLPQIERKRLLGKVKLFITMSMAFETVLRQNGLGNVACIRHFIDSTRFHPRRMTGKKTILYSGMLTPVKGVDILVRAMPKVLEKVPEATLTISGDGPERESIEELAIKLGVRGRVNFTGKMPYDAMPRIYQGASVLAVPSRGFEQFSLSGLEAMACGIPSVGSRIGGIPEWLEDGLTGFLCRPFDPGDLAEKLVRILEDHELAERMGRQAREKAVREYQPVDHARRLLEALNRVRTRKTEPSILRQPANPV